MCPTDTTRCSSLLGYPVGALICELPAFRYGLSTVEHHSKYWKIEGDEMELIELLLESRIGAYIEWLDNELIRL